MWRRALRESICPKTHQVPFSTRFCVTCAGSSCLVAWVFVCINGPDGRVCATTRPPASERNDSTTHCLSLSPASRSLEFATTVLDSAPLYPPRRRLFVCIQSSEDWSRVPRCHPVTDELVFASIIALGWLQVLVLHFWRSFIRSKVAFAVRTTLGAAAVGLADQVLCLLYKYSICRQHHSRAFGSLAGIETSKWCRYVSMLTALRTTLVSSRCLCDRLTWRAMQQDQFHD